MIFPRQTILLVSLVVLLVVLSGDGTLHGRSLSFFSPYRKPKISDKPFILPLNNISKKITLHPNTETFPAKPILKNYQPPYELIQRLEKEIRKNPRLLVILEKLDRDFEKSGWLDSISFLEREKAFYCLTLALSHVDSDVRPYVSNNFNKIS